MLSKILDAVMIFAILHLYGMPDHSFQFFRSDFSCVTQIYFMMETLIRDIQLIALCLHVCVHYLNSSRLIIISTDMHTLHA